MNANQTGALIFSWTGTRAGREGKGLEVFAKAGQYYEGLEKQGRITGTRVYLPVTGTSNGGQYIVEGNLKALLDLTTDDEFTRLAQEASLTTNDFSMNICVGGSPDSLSEGIGNYVTLLQDQGLL